MYAFKKSGVRGPYDVIEELDVIHYLRSVPFEHEKVEDIEYFKKNQAQYFTPSALIEGLDRNRENILDIQGIVFDLDVVPDWNELKYAFYDVLTISKIEMYLWLTPSGIWNGKHLNASRLFIPLAEPINPNLLSDAVDELIKLFANLNQRTKHELNLLSYGVDIATSKTISRLMGLPIQQKGSIVPWDVEERFRYKVKAEYHASTFQPVLAPEDDFMRLDEPNEENLTSFISGYVDKHKIGFYKGVRDNNLIKIIGAVKTAFNDVDESDLLAAFFNAGIAQQLDNPEKDILRKTKRLLKGA
ncbi:hypothetical protein WOSG25_250110 [Weissella oryzae SG25]|uniref:Primase C-terminal 1 domain-containing protein n=1 Tax=Weissella oryzae (strain DSM 25784 / JCM 18191 / LMG 30913 / SG25) TaxID=1329250 RepID=A0A069CW59_WEIOS|nr:hypothetical protein [Weissella oryzae]GAK32040.1 hypothetical protein WOSG25_250110 [Weissella oryzae SG25]